MKICIVGGVAGGASAATRLRRLDEKAEIVLFEKGEFISYANCGLPYYIGGTIKGRDSLIVTKPELLRERFQVDVRTESEVLSVNREKKTLTVKNHQTGETYEEGYDRLILSPGAEPKRPGMPGLELPGVFTLRTVSDTIRIDEFVRTEEIHSAVVVGGGFIGVEMAENLKERGLDVTIVEFADQVVAPLDPEMANLLHRHLVEHGVNLRLSTGITGISGSSAGGECSIQAAGASLLEVALTDGGSVKTQLVLLAMGVAPENKLAKDAGLELGLGGSIKVNEYYQTSDPDIFAVGDAISVPNLLTGKEGLVPLAGPANKQGRLAAENVLRERAERKEGTGVQGSSVLKVFELTAASTGLNEKQAKAQGVEYLKTYVHPQSHASYYPGATPVSLKMLFAPDGRVLGAQAVGYEGVEKRIDVLAAVIRLGGTVYDLEELELCYAPPYSSAKDPVNMLGFTAANQLKGDVKVYYAEEIPQLDPSKVTMVDVSTPDEVLMGSIPGYLNIPLDELREQLNCLDQSKPVYVTCRVGLRGYIGTRILMQHGFEAYNLSGGYKTYTQVHDNDLTKIRLLCAPQPADCKSHETEEAQPVKMQPMKTLEVDACGLQCPGPIMKVAEGIKAIDDGQRLCIRATDPAFASDIDVWCERTGNRLVSVARNQGVYEVILEKGGRADSCCPASGAQGPVSAGNDKTMVVFSGDLDKAIATFIIANGAAAMGRKVTLFFTFWGLNILRKNGKVHVKKNLVETMFGKMMPRGSCKLGLSRMNMGGMGAKMIRSVMKSKNVSSLEELIQSAMDAGVRIVACQMSMDVMGIHQEELLDGVEIGGVATFLGSAETSDTNLFI